MNSTLGVGKVAVVVNENPIQIQDLSNLLAKEGLEVKTFASAITALAGMEREHPPVLIVTSLRLPEVDGWRFCRLLRSVEYKSFNSVPILVVSTTYSGEEAARITADLGANAFLSVPVNVLEFGEQVRNLLQGKSPQKSLRVLIVEDEEALATVIQEAFTQHGYLADIAGSGQEAQAKFHAEAYDIAIIDHHLPDGPGNELLIRLKQLCPDAVYIAVTGDANPALGLDWIRRGAAAFVRKPMVTEYLIELCTKARRERELLQLEERLEVRTRELQESGSLYQTILQSAVDGFWRIDMEGHLLDVNEAYCRMSGNDKAALLKMRISDFEAVENDADTAAHIEKVRTTKRDRFETRHRRKDGSVYDLEVSVQYLPEAGGQMIAFLRDITERKQAEQKLREREELFREMAENIESVFWIAAPDFSRIHYVSPAYEKIFGRTCMGLYQQPRSFLDAVHPEDRERVLSSIRPHRSENQNIFEIEYRIVRFDGMIRWIRDRGFAIRDCNGKTERLVGIADDITERKRVESALQHERILLRTVIDALPDVIYAKDMSSRKILVNKAEIIAMGLHTETEALGTDDFDVYPVEMASKFLADDLRVLRDGEPVFDREESFIKPDGSRHLLLTSKIPLRNEKGDIIGLVGIGRDITEHKRAEEKLRESEERFRALVEHAGDGFELIDSKGRYVDVNSATLNQLGYTREEMLQLTVFDVDPQLNREQFVQETSSMKAGSPLLIESVHRRKDGSTFPVEVTVSRITLGNVQHSLTLVRDISGRKMVERQLQHSHHLLQYIIEHARSAIAVHDRDFKYVFVSQRYLQEYNVKEKDIIGRHHYEVFPDLPQKWRDVHQRALAGEVASAEEDPYYRDDGSVEWTRWECRPWYEMGGAIGGFIVYTEVITERVRAEQQIRKLSQAVEQSPVSIVITDLNGAIEYVNPKFTQLTGYTLEEARGQNPRILKGDQTPQEVYERIWQTISHGGQWQGELHNRKKNGQYYWEYAAISPIHDTQGRITHYLAIKEDITHRKQVEEQLRQAQKMEGIGQLAGGVAHDFNNILSAIMMYLSLLQSHPKVDADMLESLAALQIEAKRAANLTRQLLLFSRRTAIQVKPIELNEIINGMMKMLSRLIGEHIDIKFKARINEAWIEADSGMIEQVVMNLAVNARDAMPKGGSVTILTSLIEANAERIKIHPEAKAGKLACLTVRDTGCGMDSTTLQHIFEPFFTTKEAGKGTGLGLATVHGIVKQHQGWIEVDSMVGEGTEFRVFFPLYNNRVESALQLKDAQHIPRGNEMILLVEDEVTLRRAIAQCLRKLGYDVLEAANGREAVKQWSQHKDRIHLLFTDMVMPEGLTGLELAELCRRENLNLKIIISSGYSTEHSVTGGKTGEGIMYLPKPCESHVLARVIRECLDKKS